jgi:outer membrane protein assembly factor BamB
MRQGADPSWTVGKHYYIGVPASLSTISSVICAIVVAVAAPAWGQQPKEVEPGPLPLLPLQAAWTLTLEAPPSAAGAMDAERVYIPLTSEQIIAIERESGLRAWTADVESIWAPVVGAGLVFVAASDEIHALDAATGDRRWRAPVPRAFGSSMAFVDGQLIVTMEPDQVIAYAAADGRIVWNRPLGGAAGRMLLGVAPGVVCVTVSSGRVVSLSAADGAIRWERAVAGVTTAPAIARDRVIVGSTTNHFYALDASSGKEEWKWPLGGRPVGAVADGDLVVLTAMDNTVRAVNRGNGHQRWYESLPTRPQHAPLAANRLVVVPGIEPSLSGFAAKDGRAAGAYEGRPALAGPPLVDLALRPYAVAVVAIRSDGIVSALRPTAMLFPEALAVPLLSLPGRLLTREPRPDASRPR